jgi:probable HAF family extracellular repeat protein
MGKVLGARGRRARRLVLLAAPVALLAAGCAIDLGSFGGDNAAAQGVNDAGVIVGYANDPGGQQHAFRKAPGSAMVDLNGDAGSSAARSINEAGMAVGYTTTGDAQIAVAWQPDGTQVDLGMGNPSFANDINDAGAIVGVESSGAFVRDPSGHVTLLPDLSASTAIDSATAINDQGDVVGSSFEPNGPVAVLWEAPAYQPVVLSASTTDQVTANDINNDGTIVGTATYRYTSTALLWRAGTHEVVTLQKGPSQSWVFSGAAAINDAGQVAGYADEMTDTTTLRRAVRWDSPESQPVRLGGLGGGGSTALGINELGDAVGSAAVRELTSDGRNVWHAALFPFDD